MMRGAAAWNALGLTYGSGEQQACPGVGGWMSVQDRTQEDVSDVAMTAGPRTLHGHCILQ